MTQLPLVELLWHTNQPGCQCLPEQPQLCVGTVLATRTSGQVKKDSQLSHGAGKKLGELIGTVNTKVCLLGVLSLAKLVYSTGWERFLCETQKSDRKQITNGCGLSRSFKGPGPLITWYSSQRQSLTISRRMGSGLFLFFSDTASSLYLQGLFYFCFVLLFVAHYSAANPS